MQTYFDNLLASMLEENKRLATCVTTMKSLVDEAKIDCQINNPENSDNMKHSTEQNPEALQPAEKLRDAINRIELGFSDAIATNDLRLAAMELESLYTRVQELEAKEGKSSAPVVLPEPFGYFKCDAYGWMDCAETDEDARPLYEAPQPQADALDAQRYRWLRDEWLGNEPEAINMERAKGQRGLDAAIDAAITESKENT